MTTLFASRALLPSGWCENVRLQIAGGRLQSLACGANAEAGDARADCVIPGLGNAHSHAFQRALAGHTERAAPRGEDNFWTWRESMYAIVAAMDRQRLYAIARQAYAEMLAAGYTSVAEFHYLHTEAATGKTFAPMFAALREAAADAGIRLTYIPVFYERAGFDRPEPDGAQRLFATSLDDYLEHVEQAVAAADGTLSAGVGVHSIRAVTADSLARVADAARSMHVPIHIHIAEQRREVDDAETFLGARPVRWLLDNADVDDRWCLVHATHMDDAEIEALAKTRAVVCLCPSTEANLGDGLFRLPDYLALDGRVAIGSDSQISINPFEELRWLEYGQRLLLQRRNIASTRHGHVGGELFERALAGGAAACGHGSAGLVEGAPADLVCLSGDDPMLVGHDDASRLDALVFSGYRLPITRVMVDGQWRVEDAEHVNAPEIRSAFGSAIKTLMAAGEAQ